MQQDILRDVLFQVLVRQRSTMQEVQFERWIHEFEDFWEAKTLHSGSLYETHILQLWKVIRVKILGYNGCTVNTKVTLFALESNLPPHLVSQHSLLPDDIALHWDKSFTFFARTLFLLTQHYWWSRQCKQGLTHDNFAQHSLSKTAQGRFKNTKKCIAKIFFLSMQSRNLKQDGLAVTQR